MQCAHCFLAAGQFVKELFGVLYPNQPAFRVGLKLHAQPADRSNPAPPVQPPVRHAGHVNIFRIERFDQFFSIEIEYSHIQAIRYRSVCNVDLSAPDQFSAVSRTNHIIYDDRFIEYIHPRADIFDFICAEADLFHKQRAIQLQSAVRERGGQRVQPPLSQRLNTFQHKRFRLDRVAGAAFFYPGFSID